MPMGNLEIAPNPENARNITTNLCRAGTSSSTQLNSTQPEITDAGVWQLYVRIIMTYQVTYQVRPHLIQGELGADEAKGPCGPASP